MLAVLAVVGGWIQFAAVWTPIANWLDPVARPLVEATGTQEAVASIVAVALGLAGIAVAWCDLLGAPGRRRRGRAALLEHKFYFDELYDAALLPAGGRVSQASSTAVVEGPLVERLDRAASTSAARARPGRRRVTSRPGSCATYALALAAGLAVLVVVFVAVR